MKNMNQTFNIITRIRKHFENKYKKNEFRDEKTLNTSFSTLHLDDDKVVFVPAEEIYAIQSIYDKMEQAQQEFRKVAEELRNNIYAVNQ